MQAGAENRKGAKTSSGTTEAADTGAETRPHFRICELYRSVQGEGRLTGTPSIFIRTSGCNLRCWFCDTPFASWKPEGEMWTLDAVLQECVRLRQSSESSVSRSSESSVSCAHVVITGGEPMIHQDLPSLTEELSGLGFHITIETAGTVDLPVTCDLMSISPKLANSAPGAEAGSWVARHHDRRQNPEAVQRFLTDYDYQLKFVIDQQEDVLEVVSFLESLDNYDPARILLMPQGISQAELEERGTWLQPLSDKYGFRFCPRSHIEWFGNQRGT